MSLHLVLMRYDDEPSNQSNKSKQNN